MRTSVTELPESRVRVAVGVEPEALEKRIDRAARELAGEMRVPGFRKGKVPPQIVIQRVGREAVVEQALRDSLPEWYERALLEAGITPIGDPKLEVGDLPAEGEGLEFSIEVGVRPKAELGEWSGLEVGRAEPEVPDEAVQADLDRLPEGFGSLSPVERPAASPDAHRPEELAGKSASFAVAVKEVREKNLPEFDDEFAAEASEFETLDELREEIPGHLAEALSHQAEDEFRAAAGD